MPVKRLVSLCRSLDHHLKRSVTVLLSHSSHGSSRKTKAAADLHHTRQIARSCQHAQLIPLPRVKRNILHTLRATNS